MALHQAWGPNKITLQVSQLADAAALGLKGHIWGANQKSVDAIIARARKLAKERGGDPMLITGSAPKGIRGVQATQIIVDEAAQCSD